MSETKKINPQRAVLLLLWRCHSWYFTLYLSLWLIGVWVIGCAVHPGWIVAGGVFMAILGGLIFGGTDASNGVIEFVHALPFNRQRRLVTHYLIGLIPLLLFSLGSYAAYHYSLPQKIWSLAGRSIMTIEYIHPIDVYYVEWLALFGPAVAYTLVFGCNCFASNSRRLGVSIIGSIILLGVLTGAALFMENAYFGDVLGRYVLTLSGAVALPIFAFGCFHWMTRDTTDVSALKKGGWGLGLMVGVVVIVLLLMFGLVAGERKSSQVYSTMPPHDMTSEKTMNMAEETESTVETRPAGLEEENE